MDARHLLDYLQKEALPNLEDGCKLKTFLIQFVRHIEHGKHAVLNEAQNYLKALPENSTEVFNFDAPITILDCTLNLEGYNISNLVIGVVDTGREGSVLIYGAFYAKTSTDDNVWGINSLGFGCNKAMPAETGIRIVEVDGDELAMGMPEEHREDLRKAMFENLTLLIQIAGNYAISTKVSKL